MKVMLCQCSPVVGDLYGNWKMMQTEINFAVQEECDVVVFPELVTVGYPPRDFLYKQALWDSHDDLVQRIKQFVGNLSRQTTVIFGGLHQQTLSFGRTARFNAAYIISPTRCIITHKRLLPCYDVFDENRYFESGLSEPYLPVPIEIESSRLGKKVTVTCDVLICEDMWNHRFRDSNRLLPSTYTEDPTAHLCGDGPIFILNGSPFWEGKVDETTEIVKSICVDTGRAVVWVNQVGAHDDIITGGYSMVAIRCRRRPIHHQTVPVADLRIGKFFAEDRIIVQLSDGCNHYHDELYMEVSAAEREADSPWPIGYYESWLAYQAMVLHLKDYFRKTGFKKAVIGLSGGIDSAIVAAIACEALGPQNVIGLTMPSKFSSDGSISDAEQLAKNLGIKDFRTIPIKEVHNEFRNRFLSGGQQQFSKSLTDENIQPRCRMIFLMIVSSEENALLLTTGNKSEMAMGYCTLYGDTAGGLAVISDVYKTRVKAICEMINIIVKERNGGEVIPANTINKPPSAELAADQQDTDSLPPYELLDPILEDMLNDVPLNQIKLKTSIPERVEWIARQIAITEYKRVQSPPGPKLTPRSFGSGRRIPIAANLRLV